MKARLLSLSLVFLFSFYIRQHNVFAQEAPTVPDLTGMNIPQAAAALNRIGMALGKENTAFWSAESPLPADTISQQSAAPGTAVTPGAAVDVTVLHAPNVTLIYDDNDLTFINQAARRVDFGDLSFNTLQSSAPASFQAGRWAGRVGRGGCTQIWSVNRGSAKDVPRCASIERWLTTNNRAEHFWTAANGVQTFNVVQGGVERAICEAAQPGSEAQPKTCTMYLEVAANNTNAGFVYFAYTQNQFLILNRTSDRWMRLNRSILHITNPADEVSPAAFDVGDVSIYGSPEIVAKIQRLAPGQCLLYTRAGPQDPALPQQCDVIARRQFDTRVFWDYNFELQSVDDDKRRLCTAAVPDKLTLCVLPR